MSNKVPTIKLGDGNSKRFDLSKLKQLREEQASTLLDKMDDPDAEGDEAGGHDSAESYDDPRMLLEQRDGLELDISNLPEPLTQEEIIYRRTLIIKAKRWIDAFPEYLKDFKDETFDTSKTIEELENVIEEMKSVRGKQELVNNGH